MGKVLSQSQKILETKNLRATLFKEKILKIIFEKKPHFFGFNQQTSKNLFLLKKRFSET